jgi:hypothetical protein
LAEAWCLKGSKSFIKLVELWVTLEEAKVPCKNWWMTPAELANNSKSMKVKLIQRSIIWRSGVGSAGEKVKLMPWILRKPSGSSPALIEQSLDVKSTKISK